MDTKRIGRPNPSMMGVLLVASMVTGLTMTSIRRAYAAVAVPNILVTSRVTAAGAVSAGIVIPVINQSVQVSATTTAPNTLRGTVSGAVTRHSVAGFANTISSAFVNAAGTTPATLAENSSVIGQDLAYMSPGGVNASNTLEIGPSLAEVRVENDEAAATTTVVTLVW